MQVLNTVYWVINDVNSLLKYVAATASRGTVLWLYKGMC